MTRTAVKAYASGLAGLAIIVGTGVAATQVSAEDAAWPQNPEELRVETNSRLWLFGISGDVGRGNVVVDVDESFFDIAEEADSIMAFSGRVEVGKGRLAGFIDGTYADVAYDNQTGPLGIASVDVTNKIAVIDFGLLYTLSEWDVNGTMRKGTLDVYGGGRYFSLELKVDPANLPSRKNTNDIIDPIVGLRLRQPLAEDWSVQVWGDVGGGGDSDLTWSATGLICYHFQLFSRPATFQGGYRAMAWDYEDGSGTDRVVFDAMLHGPTIGLQMSF